MKLPWVERCAGCQYLLYASHREHGRCAMARPVVWDADDGWVPTGGDFSCDKWDDGQLERSAGDEQTMA